MTKVQWNSGTPYRPSYAEVPTKEFDEALARADGVVATLIQAVLAEGAPDVTVLLVDFVTRAARQSRGIAMLAGYSPSDYYNALLSAVATELVQFHGDMVANNGLSRHEFMSAISDTLPTLAGPMTAATIEFINHHKWPDGGVGSN